jgi:subtilisin family serine protease
VSRWKRVWSRWLPTLCAGLVAAAGGGTAAVSAAAVPEKPFVGEHGLFDRAGESVVHKTRTLTLLTGDRVRGHKDGYVVEPGAGRERIPFQQQRSGGHDYVLPADAVGLVSSGRVDRRLFDVTTLFEMGYADEQQADLPLLVTPDGPATAAKRPTTEVGRVVRELPSAGVQAVRVSKRQAQQFWSELLRGEDKSAAGGVAASVRKVWLDGRRQVSLDRSVPQIGAPTVWKTGFTGRGVRVAVLDTGIDAAHPDFAGRIARLDNFTDDPDANDVVGHGTHVASTIAGSGAASDGRYKGVAPDATLLIGKVCTALGCPESAILAGMEWAAASGADVVNLSLGGADNSELDPLEEAVNTLTARHGTLFVIAAGNNSEPRTVSSPASADAALAVGAVDADDALAEFSSRGPRLAGGAIKPEITAPGVDIVAARASGSEPGDPVDPWYARMSGTSMATPHVSGAAALLAQQHQGWQGGQLKAALMGSAVPKAGLDAFAQGAGRVDIAAAAARPIWADPPALDMGVQAWPHNDDQPVTQTVTYRNESGTSVTLSLAVEVATPGGAPAPTGMFRVQPQQLIVPPGGTASSTVTADTRVSGPEGGYDGRLVATVSSGGAVRTPLVIDREPESYNLVLTHLDRTGALTWNYSTTLDSVSTAGTTWPYEPDGTVSVRLPKGRYHLSTTIFSDGSQDATLLTQPEVSLVEDTRIVLDARMAKRSAVTVPRPGAKPIFSILGYYRHLPDGQLVSSSVFSNGGFEPLYTAHLGAALPAAQMRGRVLSWWFEPGPAGGAGNSAHIYNLGWYPPGRLPSGFRQQVQHRDLAIVQANHRTALPGSNAEKVTQPSMPDYVDIWAVGNRLALPATRTEYYTTQDGVRWSSELRTMETDQTSTPTAYPIGEQVEQWQAAPFGPSLPAAADPSLWVSRTGDTMSLFPPLFGDATVSHAGVAATESQQLTLSMNGQPLEPGEDGSYSVPPEPASYRLTAQAVRPSDAQLSTKVNVTWTFRSGHTEGTQRLPIMAVRFAPQLDEQNAAPAGRQFRFPLTVQRQAGAMSAPLASLTVEVSYDEGRTWQAVQLVGSGEKWTATVSHPPGTGFASLRATAVDNAGDAVQQTIIHAYQLRG